MGELILSIGDVHGEDRWKDLGDIRELVEETSTEPKFDRYVFVGDYVDSFWVRDVEMVSNLEEIVAFKRAFPNKVELLLGNHDIQYFLEKNWLYRCSGYNDGIYPYLHELFVSNEDIFKIAYSKGKVLWSHAGVHALWADKINIPQGETAEQIATRLNKMWEDMDPDLFDVGYLRGGMERVGGPLWVDKQKLYKGPYNGIDQVVGHTNVHMKESYSVSGNTLHFIDSLTQWDIYSPLITEKLARGLVLYVND